MALKLVPPNRWYGFRVPQTLTNADVWWRANRFSGIMLMLAALTAGLILCFQPEGALLYAPLVILGSVCLAVVISFLYLNRIT